MPVTLGGFLSLNLGNALLGERKTFLESQDHSRHAVDTNFRRARPSMKGGEKIRLGLFDAFVDAYFQRLEPRIDLREPFIDLSEPFIDLSEPFIDLSEPFVDPRKVLVDPRKVVVDPRKVVVDPRKVLVDLREPIVKV
jgi:hypothetical protein